MPLWILFHFVCSIFNYFLLLLDCLGGGGSNACILFFIILYLSLWKQHYSPFLNPISINYSLNSGLFYGHVDLNSFVEL